MKLILNGRPHESAARDLDALFRIEAEETGIESPQGIAIALNGAVIRRRDWETTQLEEGDRVEIVRAMQGG
ncbi:thiamine biosynthesis protein ThiS [Methylobacterium sp. Leaf469]|jgi:sulfur carrier protein|uniref:sulfur carrier protein ThiS n=1 Tax=unclassified Methylobacterium TaxID=2615210 RepID=UPI0006F39BF7|nr:MULTISPECIES: sulfur carrier protein ThiS [unclassified Methylobacterium]USU32507.1 sulfur carrier protein ThiS [Methylobacterium sp. OTU13CASTA1]KQP17445.1 thiamine biosynthesis protein ThiS [Methylobacterium sp. Leaf100]KQP22194.1 thiamine biosynthesis protein ThiS [Methylobacterium sp. Leaf102]KQP59418.1 thiamine biosynthesis protein ThiS [Methylobacterium sp. Leaf112]KQT86666.1 thiamine biosynthesis protein ThiS [Methylobacterium sp. Leaf469]